jgi:AraC-like DNA-binding protein
MSLLLSAQRKMGQLPVWAASLQFDLPQQHVEYFPPTGFLYLNLYESRVGTDKPDAANETLLRWKTGQKDCKTFKPGQILAGGMLSDHPAVMDCIGRGQADILVLHPVVAYHFIQDRLDLLTDSFDDLRDLIGREVEPLLHQLEDGRIGAWTDEALWQFFLKRAGEQRRWAQDPVFHAVNLIIQKKGLIRVKELAAEVFMSERNLERHFLQKVGVSPKTYAGNWRFQYALQLLQTKGADTLGNVVDLAGYYDISHFMKDLKEKTGEGFERFLRAVPGLMQCYLEVVQGK